jgi:hypothetical protein
MVPATNDILFDDAFAFIKADGILAGPVDRVPSHLSRRRIAYVSCSRTTSSGRLSLRSP